MAIIKILPILIPYFLVDKLLNEKNAKDYYLNILYLILVVSRLSHITYNSQSYRHWLDYISLSPGRMDWMAGILLAGIYLMLHDYKKKTHLVGDYIQIMLVVTSLRYLVLMVSKIMSPLSINFLSIKVSMILIISNTLSLFLIDLKRKKLYIIPIIFVLYQFKYILR